MPPGRTSSQRRSAPSTSASTGPKASAPGFTHEQIDEYLEIPDVIGGEDGDFIIQLHRECMSGEGILNGDYLVVRPTDELEADMVVVVPIGEEVTLMLAYRDGEDLRLRPEDEALEPMVVSEASVLGRVVGVIRKV